MDAGKTLYVRLASNVGTFKGEMAGAASAVTAFGAKTDAQMARLQGYAKTNQQGLRSLGNAAGAAGLVAAVGLGVAIKKFADFDEEMSSVQAATHATTNEMAALRAEAIQLGADSIFTAGEAAQGITELAKAGVATADILDGGLKGSLDLAAAGEIGVGEAAEIAATAMTQFNLAGDKIPHLADLLAAGAGKAQGGVTELGQALAQAGLVAGNMGLSIEDTTGSLAAFASAGLIGSDSGTAFKTMIQRLQAPMGRGAKALEKYGISAYDAQGNFVGITNVADQLQQKLGGLTQETRDAALAQIFGSDAIRAATVLYKQGGDGIQGWIDKTNDAGYAAETARLKTDNLAGDIERLGGELDSFFIGMGAGADGPAREFVQVLEQLVAVGTAIPGPLKSIAVAGLAVTAVFGGTVFAATRLIGAVESTRAGLNLLQVTAWKTTARMTTMKKSMMLANIGKGAAGLAGLALASSDVADGFALSNTASFGLMGVWGGPLGIAAGAAAGFITDVAASTDKMGASFDRAADKFDSSTTFQGYIDNLEKVQAAQDATVESAQSIRNPLKLIKIGFDSLVGSNVFEEQAQQADDAAEATRKYTFGIQSLEDQTIGAKDGVNELFDPIRMQQFADQVGPVLDELGLKLSDVLSEGPKGKNWSTAVAAINEWKAEADTAAGKSKALADSMAGLDNEMLTAAGSSSDLAKALKGLFSPEMDYDAAIIAWHESLRALRKELGSGTQSLDLQTEAGAANVTQIQSSVNALTAQMTAAAGAGESSEQMARRLASGRQSIIDQAVAVGFNADAVSNLIDKYGLTPELVKTILDAKDLATPKIDGVDAKLRGLDGNTATVTVATLLNTYRQTFQKPPKYLAAPDQAKGGFYPGGLPAAANGLYNDAHIQRASTNRTIRYAEPETQGESFIPHAMNKRKKSTQILGKTAARFGYDLSPRGMESAGGGRQIVVQQAARGPLVGQLTIPAMNRADASDTLHEVGRQLRKIERGGRW